MAVGRIPVGDLAARLQRHAGVAAEDEGVLENRVRAGEGRVDAADVEPAREAQVVAELGMDQRRRRIERGLRVSAPPAAPPSRPAAAPARPRPARASRRPPRPPARPASRRARSPAGSCGALLMPARWPSTPTQGLQIRAISAPIDDRDDARHRLRSLGSMPRMRMCATGLRQNTTCASRGSSMSSTYCPRPCVSRRDAGARDRRRRCGAGRRSPAAIGAEVAAAGLGGLVHGAASATFALASGVLPARRQTASTIAW